MRIFSWQINAVKLSKGESVVFFKTKDPEMRTKLVGLATGELAIYKKRARKQAETPSTSLPEAAWLPEDPGTGEGAGEGEERH